MSGAWTADGNEVLVAGFLDGAIFRFSRQGKLLEKISHSGPPSFAINRPTYLSGLPNGFLLRDESYHLLLLDQDLKPTQGFYFDGSAEKQFTDRWQFGETLRLRDTLITRGNFFLDGAWKDGFIELRLGDTLTFERLLTTFDERSKAGRLSRMVGPTLAATDSGIYGLQFDQRIHVQELFQQHRELDAFPAGMHLPIDLPDVAGNPNGSAVIYRYLEGQTLVTGIYGQGKFLFLLSREPHQEEGTLWRLHQVDPGQDKIVRTLTLPTTAPRISLIPGAQHWAILEKGRFDAQQMSDGISHMVLLPSSWLQNLQADVLTEHAGSLNCD